MVWLDMVVKTQIETKSFDDCPRSLSRSTAICELPTATSKCVLLECLAMLNVRPHPGVDFDCFLNTPCTQNGPNVQGLQILHR